MGKNKYMQRCRIGPRFKNKGVISSVLKLGENQHGSHVCAAPEELSINSSEALKVSLIPSSLSHNINTFGGLLAKAAISHPSLPMIESIWSRVDPRLFPTWVFTCHG